MARKPRKDPDALGYTTTVHHYPNCIVRVHRPILPPDVYARRMEKFKQATAEFVIAAQRSKAEAVARRAAEEKEKRD